MSRNFVHLPHDATKKSKSHPHQFFCVFGYNRHTDFYQSIFAATGSRARSKASEEGDRVSRNDNLCLTTTTNHIEDKAVVRADAEPFRDAETKTLE